MTSLFSRFLREQRAATAIEYAFIVMLIALVVVGSISALGTTLTGSYNSVADGFPK